MLRPSHDAARLRTYGAAAITAMLALFAASTPTRVRSQDAAPARLAVIVGLSSATRNIDLATLRRAFGGAAVTDPSGRRYIPLNQRTGLPARERFDRRVLGLEPAQVGRHWVDQRIRLQLHPPRTVDSPALLVRVIAKLPGSIAYVHLSDLTAEVRPLPVDGRAHNHADYPL